MKCFGNLRIRQSRFNQLSSHSRLLLSTKINQNNVLSVENPFTGDIHCELPFWNSEDNATEIESLLSSSVSSQNKYWRETGGVYGLVERQRLCMELIDSLESKADEICNDLSCSMGKPLQESYNEISGMRERAQSLIELSTQYLSDEPLPPKIGFSRKIRKEPLGTVLIISPWNYPILCTINSLIPAILAGNSVILKLSSKTPSISNHFVNAFNAVGFNENLVSALNCDHDTTSNIMRDDRIASVVFTGSVQGGLDINKTVSNCNTKFIDCTLELGGKDAAYVRNDCDLKYAVQQCVDGSMYNAGQSCCAIERVYVHKDVYSEFIELALQTLNENYANNLGNPLSLDTKMGPMAQHQSSIPFLEKQVKDAIDKGAILCTDDSSGKRCFDASGKCNHFFKPTILSNCNHSMSIMKDESFGPIMAVQCVDSDEEAINLINDSDYGLTCAVFTKDLYKMDRYIAPKIQTGTVFMNRCDYLDPLLPWTGRKLTGKGVSLSPYCFRNFYNLKSLHYKLNTEQ